MLTMSTHEEVGIWSVNISNVVVARANDYGLFILWDWLVLSGVSYFYAFPKIPGYDDPNQ